MSTTEEPVQITINASPEILYTHLVDFRNHVAWNHQLVSITQTTPDPIQVSTVFEAFEQVPASIPGWLEPVILFLLRLFGAGPPQSRAEITDLIPNEKVEWMAQSSIDGEPDMQVK